MRQPASAFQHLHPRREMRLVSLGRLQPGTVMATFIVLSSLVARGSVGLRVTVPALQRLGHEAIALPTILLSSHLGYARVAGTTVAAETVDAMIEALDANGWLASADSVITGYLPSADHVDVAAALVARVRRDRPDVPLFCDPVLGDAPDGLYVPEGVAEAVRERLIPLATYLKPNAFELGYLSGRSVGGVADAVAAARALGVAHVLASSIPAGRGMLANVLVTDGRALVCTVPYKADAPHGTGDLLTALLAGRLIGTPPASLEDAAARAAAGVASAIASSLGRDELALSSATPWHAAEALPLTTFSGSGP